MRTRRTSGWIVLCTKYLFISSPPAQTAFRYYKFGTSKTVRFAREVAECLTKLPENVSQEQKNKPFPIISKSSNASCTLDPIPTWLVKSCLDVLAPSITHVVNLSIRHA